MSKTICIGIVAYNALDDGQVAEDYLSLMYYLGRNHPEYNFQIALKYKSEQFRARKAIVKAALQNGADYIWMLDDDHIIDQTRGRNPAAYDLPVKLVEHMEKDPKIGVVGALYYQRGDECYPVFMQEVDGQPYFMLHSEVTGGMQKVDVTGGGCIMLRASMFDKISEPWFAPEHEYGTDIQICKQARKAGYEVWCDTSLEIGHLLREKIIVNTDLIKKSMGHKTQKRENWELSESLAEYRNDALEYLGVSSEELTAIANKYSCEDIGQYTDLKEYYASKGNEQLARQVLFHHADPMVEQINYFHAMINTNQPHYGCDFGCGSAAVTFDFAKHHDFDFVDIDGAGAYEFLKWRCKKHGVNAGFELKGPYDYVFMLDSLEHIKEWKDTLTLISSHIKKGGALITNYFANHDTENPEHVSMDHDAVREWLGSLGFKPTKNEVIWQK